MSSALTDAKTALETAAAGVEGLVVGRLGEAVRPPAFVVLPPQVTTSTMCAGLTDATFTAYLVVAMDGRAVDRLLDLLPALAEAIEEGTDGVVTTATAGVYAAPQSGDLPAYELTIDYPLS